MSNFYVWIDDPNASDTTMMPLADMQADSQRRTGFASGQPASSKRVNTMLRQSSLVTVALMNALGLTDDSLSSRSPLTTIQSAIENSSLFNLAKVISYSDLGANRFALVPLLNATLGTDNNRFSAIYGDLMGNSITSSLMSKTNNFSYSTSTYIENYYFSTHDSTTINSAALGRICHFLLVVGTIPYDLGVHMMHDSNFTLPAIASEDMLMHVFIGNNHAVDVYEKPFSSMGSPWSRVVSWRLYYRPISEANE